MEKLAGGDGHRRPARPRPAAEQDHRVGRRAPRRRHPRHHGRGAGPRRATRSASTEIRDAGARVRLIQTATSAPRCSRSPTARRSTCCGASAARPRASSPPRRSSRIGGGLVGRLWPRDDDERQAAIDEGYDLDRQLTQDDLVKGDDCFFSATGVTDGDVLQGVRYQGARGATTESLVMRSRSGTVRRIHARHDRTKLRALSPASATAERRPCGQPQPARARLRRARRRPRAPRDWRGRVVVRPARAKRPMTDFSRSRRASERRKPCVTITWIRDCVLAYSQRPSREAIAG